ncbi:hypothetical protein AGMMS49990_02640 [Endomicrobiia bacterium]|nr:hypothetical protein AGMMS49990_02640 [Endomicrobiia bacterium]
MKAKTMLLNVIMLSGLTMLSSCKSCSKCEPTPTDGPVRSVKSSYKPTNFESWSSSSKPYKLDRPSSKLTDFESWSSSSKPYKLDRPSSKPTNFESWSSSSILNRPSSKLTDFESWSSSSKPYEPVKPVKITRDAIGQPGYVPQAPPLSKKDQDSANRVPPPGPPLPRA